MGVERDIRCVVSGSFSKFKPEIDLTIDELTDIGVTVLAPDKGWLHKAPTRLYSLGDKQFRPLPTEKGMSPREVEDSFLEALSNSDFVYVVNPGGYVGDVVSLEMGFAIGLGIPIYSQEPISPALDIDPMWKERISNIRVCSAQEAVIDFERTSTELNQ